MLFNSHIFLFLFLPLTLLIFFSISSYSHRLGAMWLTAASLFFYGWWNPAYVGLLMCSVLLNYATGATLAKEHARGRKTISKTVLFLGIAANICLLAYYKYANFFLGAISGLTGTSWTLEKIILPLGISFFTFTQIAYLVDAWRGEVREYNFIHYSLFVTYFPHLIAGPILHHKEIMPQFSQAATYKIAYENIGIGLTVFSIGLFKKVILADTIAPYANVVFATAARGGALTFIESWSGAIFYALQLYFDFSGYSDMAIGLSRLIGVKLPLNFHSPYQAVNIIDFWRRWHMTLSRFLKDYLYIPLGGSRKGSVRRYINLMITMLLGGLWHGAGWPFVIWGALHGFYLVINNAWRSLRTALRMDMRSFTWWGRPVGRIVTFTAVVAAWVIFRAENAGTAAAIYRGMLGMNGIVLPEAWLSYSGPIGRWLAGHGVMFGITPAFQGALQEPLLIVGLLSLVWFFPNTQQIMGRFHSALEVYAAEGRKVWEWLKWEPSWKWAVFASLLMTTSIVMIDKVSEFLYFQF